MSSRLVGEKACIDNIASEKPEEVISRIFVRNGCEVVRVDDIISGS